MRHVRFALTLVALLTLPGWMPAQAADAPVKEPAKRPAAASADCPKPTGSRITPHRDSRGECPRFAGAGRVYEKEDLERTGTTDVREALRQLDPALR